MNHPHLRRHDLPFRWPDPPFRVVLVRPEIPPNTGNIVRLCAATGCPLHLVGPLGFRLTDKSLKRAGLDYWDDADWQAHADWDAFRQAVPDDRLHLFSTGGTRCYTDVRYQPGDLLLFGSESVGLPDPLLRAYPDRVLGVPMRPGKARSLNLSNTVAIVVYEALRQANKI